MTTQRGRVRFEAGNVTFIVQHELWDGNIQDHSDQGVVILAEVGGETALRFNCFDIEKSYVYAPDGENTQYRMDHTVDGNPIGWSVKTMRTNLDAMLTRAGYGDAAGSLDMNAVNAAPGRSGRHRADQVRRRAQHRQAQPRHRHHRSRQHPLRPGDAPPGLRRRRAGHPRPSATSPATPAACSPRRPNCWPSTASGTSRTTTMARATRTTGSSGTRRWFPIRWAGASTSSRPAS